MTGKKGEKRKDTPLRKLICKMPEVAVQVLEKCVTRPENTTHEHPEFYVDFNFEFIDDNFSNWSADSTADRWRQQGAWNNSIISPLFLIIFLYFSEEVYDHSRGVVKGKKPYTENTSKLKDNHILMVTVRHNQDEIVSHPLMLGKYTFIYYKKNI